MGCPWARCAAAFGQLEAEEALDTCLITVCDADEHPGGWRGSAVGGARDGGRPQVGTTYTRTRVSLCLNQPRPATTWPRERAALGREPRALSAGAVGPSERGRGRVVSLWPIDPMARVGGAGRASSAARPARRGPAARSTNKLAPGARSSSLQSAEAHGGPVGHGMAMRWLDEAHEAHEAHRVRLCIRLVPAQRAGIVLCVWRLGLRPASQTRSWSGGASVFGTSAPRCTELRGGW